MDPNPPFIASWTATPIPNLSLSAGGLLALADLNTIAQRTAIAGGSSWLDAFVLAPGLHYQQAADLLTPEYGAGRPVLSMALDGGAARYVVNNVAMVKYLRRLWEREGKYGVVTLCVKMDEGEGLGSVLTFASSLSLLLGHEASASSGKKDHHNTSSNRRRWQRRQQRGLERLRGIDHESHVKEALEMDWVSHALYLLSPLLTVSAIVFMVLLQDWWGLGFIIALMASRLANIWAIKERSRPAAAPPKPLAPPAKDDAATSPEPTAVAASIEASLPLPVSLKREDTGMTEYTIDWGQNRRVILKGLDADLRAVTTEAWLRAKTTLEGYLEAMSKLIVYMVASLSGNLSEAGAIVLMSLLLISAGLLGLSNAHATSMQMHGRRVGRLKVEKVQIAPLDPRLAVEGQIDAAPEGIPVHIVPVVSN
ncbi:uncharacterized protein TrAFT101_010470 [Trichoderma asperellum]|uniref:Uncharacterized protein n=1 Tax=Trichoderma asperellum (strain ATCC 204424 / CBS 433.97 / NBRC 101777) TaxID=1042311 RepID=A0A2T3YVK4_TRIA4|nr:hypothetical protein M441DRAFT_62058 [Trichoderma asperellum CBS 433.97]PTB36589.1 hypothetical protein M441DRAFT_62058 [Trichoderma asperellum CBS 433.97]UKZ95645.1 hypothetical protein TrAFT101_010470 [Trichoderma asperellum]